MGKLVGRGLALQILLSLGLPRRRTPVRVCFAVCVVLSLLAGATSETAWGLTLEEVETAAEQLEEPLFDPAGVRSVGSLKLGLGLATLAIEEGRIYPGTPVASSQAGGVDVREFVFIGKARLELEPPDSVEEGQLELFTGFTSLDETVTEAVLVLAPDAAADALLKRSTPTTPDGEASARAAERFDAWANSGERHVLGVETALLGDVLGDPFDRGYFAGWFRGESLGDFVYLNDPRAYEQFTLGQFVPLDLTEKERRKVSKRVRKVQRRGRLLGVELETLGQFDTWVSASNRRSDGSTARGASCFSSEHYDIDLEILPKTLELRGKVGIRVRPKIDGCLLAKWDLNRDLVVSSVRDAAGQRLYFDQRGSGLFVAFPEAPAAGETFDLLVQYQGVLIDEFESARILMDTQSWFPNNILDDWATFDVRFTWPKRYEVLASGIEVERGEDGPSRWMRKKLEIPSHLFTFELGRYKFSERQVGDVRLRVAMDPETREVALEADEILDAAEDALTYFSEIYGPYPHSELTLVSAIRAFSQASPALVTLSALMVAEESFWVSDEDPRSVIAHEIAHQWWGHTVGFASHRDAWISEALANYSALLFARNRLGQQRLGPTKGWQSSLTSTDAQGRTVESIGPIVLGSRLESSQSSAAYSAIVYSKGAVVLDMLARSYGEETFIKVLAALLRAVPQQSLSTEEFLDLVERITGSELDVFADQFIYGTGLPEVYYDFEVEPADDGWSVKGTARQVAPYRYEYAVVDRDGGLAIERTADVGVDVSNSRLVVPVQVAVYDPEHPNAKAKDPKTRGNRVQVFHAVLSGEQTPIDLTVESEPKQVWLDAGEQVFGRFYNANRSPKRVAYYQGLDYVAAKDYDRAAAAFASALGAEVEVGVSFEEDMDEKERLEEQQWLDFRIYRSMTHAALDQGKTAQADEAWRQAQGITRKAKGGRDWLKTLNSEIIGARLALAKRDPQKAFDLLRKDLLKSGRKSRFGELLLAIAAYELGRDEELEELLERANKKGSDVTLLEQRHEQG